MSDTGFVFRASWPILDDSLPISVLRDEAAERVDEIAHKAGCCRTGELSWTVLGNRLYAEGPAVPLPPAPPRSPYGEVAGRADQIRRLAGEGWSDSRMAAAFGCTSSAVAKVRQRHGIRPGVGNPTMSGEQQQRKGQAA